MSRKMFNIVIKNGNANEFTITLNLSAEEYEGLLENSITVTNEEALIKTGVDFNTLNNLLLENRRTKIYLEVIVDSDNKEYFYSPLGVTFFENQAIALCSLGVFDSSYFAASFTADEVMLSIQS